MTDWPQAPDGERGGNRRYGRGSAGEEPESARVMRHVRPGEGRTPRSAPPGSGVPRQPSHGQDDSRPLYRDEHGRASAPAQSYDSDWSNGEVYESHGGRRPPQPPPPNQGSARRAPRPGRPVDWRRRITVGLVTCVVLLLVVSVSTYFWADSKLKREVDLAKVIERPEAGEGTNYLIVGSDSREGMTDDQKKELHTGSADGKRTDSMMILHVGDNGNTMVSLPRDSNVTIPSFVGSDSGKQYPSTGRQVKLNSAYSEDGPELLVRTVEFNTGLRIDHYAEIGFAGFANVVDAMGGVEMDFKEPVKDKYSGADFAAGTQTLDGKEALAFVRTRHAFTSDLDRTKNQQKFLSTLASQAATPSTVLNPFRLYPVMGAGLDTLIVDKDMGIFDVASMFWAMKGVTSGEGTSLNMPTNGSSNGNLVWDEAKKKQLVEQLKNDEKVTVSDK